MLVKVGRFTGVDVSRAWMLTNKAFALARRYVGGYFERRRFTPAEHPKLSIETTNICNAACVFCPNAQMKRRKEPLAMDGFRKAIDEFAAMGGTTVDFNVTIGDPLLDPKLLERARYVRQYPQLSGLGFVTALQWLHRFDLDEFFAAGFSWLSVSTTLSGRERYVEFFQVDHYEQMFANLRRLLYENQRRGRPMHINIDIKPTNEPRENVLTHPDFQAINRLVEQDLEEVVKRQSFYVDDWGGAVRLPSYLNKRPLLPRAYCPCRMLYSGLILYSNGRVGACACRDFEASSELNLGYVADLSLPEMWTGGRLNTLRRDWRRQNKVPVICRTCTYYVH